MQKTKDEFRMERGAPRLVRVMNKLDKFIRTIGGILKIFQLDGNHHIIDEGRHIFERIIWLLIVLATCCGLFYMCFNQWIRYKANPTVISLERDYRHWNGTMPAITLCYPVKANRSRVEEYVKRTWAVGPTDERFNFYSEFVETMANMTLDRIYTIFNYGEDERLRDLNLRNLVEFVYPNYFHTIRAFDDSLPIDTQLILSERGMCHVINAPISKVLTTQPVHSVDELNQTLSCFMYKNVCFLRVDFYNVSATIEVHSPEEVPVFDSPVLQFNPSEELAITYKFTETLASDSLKSLAFVQRNCVFRSEAFDKFPTYSGKLCEMNCRARNAIIHFISFSFLDAPECDLRGYLCLHEKSWPMWTLRSCKCPESCVHYSYTERTRSVRTWTSEVLFSPKGSFRWEIVTTKLRNRRDVIFSFADFVGAFGGAAALLLGVNFWNLALISLKIAETFIRCRWGRA